MVNITKFAVRRPVTIVLCLITIAYFGIQSLMGTSIELTPEMEQYHLSMTTVGQLVGAADFTIPAGDIQVVRQKLDVSVGNDYEDVEKLKTIAIPLSGGDVIHLSDIANVYSALEEADSIGRYNGEDVISLGIKKQQSATAI